MQPSKLLATAVVAAAELSAAAVSGARTLSVQAKIAFA